MKHLITTIILLFSILSFQANAENLQYDASCDIQLNGKIDTFFILKDIEKDNSKCLDQSNKTSLVFTAIDKAESGTMGMSITSNFKKLIGYIESPDSVYFHAFSTEMVGLVSLFIFGAGCFVIVMAVWNGSKRGKALKGNTEVGEAVLNKLLVRGAVIIAGTAMLIGVIGVALYFLFTLHQHNIALQNSMKNDKDEILKSQVLDSVRQNVEGTFKDMLNVYSCTYSNDKQNIKSFISSGGNDNYFFDELNNEYLRCARSRNLFWNDTDHNKFIPEYLKTIKHCAETEKVAQIIDCGYVSYTDDTKETVKSTIKEVESDFLELTWMYHNKACVDAIGGKDPEVIDLALAIDCMSYHPLTKELKLDNKKFVAVNTNFSIEQIRAKEEAIKAKLVNASYSTKMAEIVEEVKTNNYLNAESAGVSVLGESRYRAYLRNKLKEVGNYSVVYDPKRKGSALESKFTLTNMFGEEDGGMARTPEVVRLDEYIAKVNAKPYQDSVRYAIFESINYATGNFYKNAGYSLDGCLSNQCPKREANQVSNIYAAAQNGVNIGVNVFAAFKAGEAIYSMFGTKNPNRPDFEATPIEMFMSSIGNFVYGIVVVFVVVIVTIIWTVVVRIFLALYEWFTLVIMFSYTFPLHFMTGEKFDRGSTKAFKPLLQLVYVVVYPTMLYIGVYLCVGVVSIFTMIYNGLFFEYMIQNAMFAAGTASGVADILNFIMGLIFYILGLAYVFKTTFDRSDEYIRQSLPEALFGSQDLTSTAFVRDNVMKKLEGSTNSAASGFKVKRRFD